MKQQISDINRRVLNVVNCITVLFTIILFTQKNNAGPLLYPICIAYFILITSFSILFFGYKKDKKSKDKTKINSIYIIFTILYIISIYLVGAFVGYLKIKIKIEQTIYLILLLAIIEIFRYVLITKASKSSNESYILSFILIAFDVLILSSSSPTNMPNTITLIKLVLTSAIKNAMLSYTTGNFTYKPCILFSLIVSGLPSIAPIYPNLGNYITIVLLVAYTLTIFYNISKPTRKEEEETANEYERGFLYYIERFALVLVIVIIFFVSGVFKYSISAIASDSMFPEIRKGDAVIIEKADEKNIAQLEKGMIIAFKEGEQVITHRIFDIEETDEKKYFITKGDNNPTKDVTKKTKDDIIGIVRFKIPYVGYPSVEISEIKNKNKQEEKE